MDGIFVSSESLFLNSLKESLGVMSNEPRLRPLGNLKDNLGLEQSSKYEKELSISSDKKD